MIGVSVISLEHLMKSNVSKKKKTKWQLYRMIKREDNQKSIFNISVTITNLSLILNLLVEENGNQDFASLCYQLGVHSD